MYIWKINALVEALKEDKLTEKQKKNYKMLFIVILIFTISSFFIVLDPSTFNHYDVIDLVGFVTINAIGILIVYRINKHGNNKDFVLRYLTLTIPIFLRIFVYTTAIALIGYMILPFYLSLSLEETNIFDLIISLLSEIVFTLMMIKYFKKIN